MTFPPEIQTCTVHGAYYLGTGEPADGYLIFTPSAIVKDPTSNIVISNADIHVALLGNGTFSIDLPICQTSLVPNVFLWHVQEWFYGVLLREWDIRLDSTLGSSVSLVSLSPAAPPSSEVSYPTLSDVASVAANLDSVLSAQIAVVAQNVADLGANIGNTLTTADLGVNIPTLVGGKIPSNYIPPVTVGNVYTVASQAAMLALSAVKGDLAVRTDVGTTYILAGSGDPTILANWTQLLSGASVSSVNGHIGAVTLNYIDVGAASVTHTHTTLSLTNITASSGAFSTLSTQDFSVGNTGSSRVHLTSSVIEFFDASNARWLWVDRATTRLELTNGTMSLGSTAGGRLETPSPVNSVAGSAYTSTTTMAQYSQNASAAGPRMIFASTWDTSSSAYTNTTLTMSSGTGSVGGANRTSTLTLDEIAATLAATRVGSTTASLVIDYDGSNNPRAVMSPATTFSSTVTATGALTSLASTTLRGVTTFATAGGVATATVDALGNGTFNNLPPIVVGGSLLVTTNASGDATITTGLSTITAAVAYNGNGPFRSDLVFSRNTWSGGSLQIRVHIGQSNVPYVGQTQVDWIAFGS